MLTTVEGFCVTTMQFGPALHHSDFCLLFPLSTGPQLLVVVNKTCETIAEYRYIIAII